MIGAARKIRFLGKWGIDLFAKIRIFAKKGTFYVFSEYYRIFLYGRQDVMEDLFIQRNRSNYDKYLHMPTISQTDTFSKYLCV